MPASINEAVKTIKIKYAEFNAAPKYKFKEVIKPNSRGRPKSGVFDYVGFYVIYEGRKVIYVGSAGASKGEKKHMLKYRLANLFQYSPESKGHKFSHTLTEKLLSKPGYKRFGTFSHLKKFYYTKCSFKAIRTDTAQDARMLEYVFIKLHNPHYNDEHISSINCKYCH